jgi:hypothetical protein
MSAERELASLAPRQTLSEADVRRMIDQVEDKIRMLAEANTVAKSALYGALGIGLTYDPRRESVLVESRTDSWALDRVGGGTPTGLAGVEPCPLDRVQGRTSCVCVLCPQRTLIIIGSWNFRTP